MKFNYGQFGCTGIKYDGVDVSDVFAVVDVSVSVLPSIEAVTQELAQRPGQYFASRKVGAREVKLKLALDAESRCPVDIFKAWRDVSGVFNKPDPRRLYLSEDKYINALFVGESEIEDQGYKGVCELSFVCFDPFFYGTRHDVALSGTTAFKVMGGVGAFPVIEATGAAGALTVTNETTGEFVTVPNVSASTKVVIDMAAQRATANGEYAPVDLLSDFFMIDGEASIRISGGSAKLSYEERYL